ncbi:MAG: ABC transporter ATP-binding protein [Planctomycetota bacterium]
MDDKAVSWHGVSFAYGAVPVLQDVTLEAGKKDFLCLIGPNGGGKTTLLRLALGQLRPNQGTVRIFSQPPELARQEVGYVPQHFQYDAQFPVRVLDVVLMGRLGPEQWWHPFHRKPDIAAAHEALHEVRLQDLAHRPFSRLSGGQRQRVLIARSLAAQPRLLLLDEPTASVDAAAESMIYELLHRLNERLCVVMVTHDLAFVSKFMQTAAYVDREVALYAVKDLTEKMLRPCAQR